MTTQVIESTLILTPDEDLNVGNTQKYQSEWQQLIQKDTQYNGCIINLENTSMIDSEGLNLIIGVFKECQKLNIQFKVSNTSEDIKRLFSYLKINKFFRIE